LADLLPLMFNESVHAQVLIPVPAWPAFGVMFATVITQLVVPSSCMIFDNIDRLRRRLSSPNGASLETLAPETNSGR